MSFELLVDPSLLQLALLMSTPLLLAALGELIIERSGILNVAIEGMMSVGAGVGFLVAFFTEDHLLGSLAAMAAVALMGWLLGYYGITLRANQLIIGLGLFIFGLGLPSLLYRIAFGPQMVAPRIDLMPSLAIPFLSEIPYIGPVLFDQPLLVYLTYLLVPVLSFFLFRTPLGLQLRACGENPRAADTLGVNIIATRYACVIIGAAIIGLAGYFIPAIVTATYTDNIIGGRGWIALQLVIFGRWLPGASISGALLFAYIEALQYRLALIAKSVPPQLFQTLPYIVAILVMIQVYQRAEKPAALMQPYNREARG